MAKESREKKIERLRRQLADLENQPRKAKEDLWNVDSIDLHDFCSISLVTRKELEEQFALILASPHVHKGAEFKLTDGWWQTKDEDYNVEEGDADYILEPLI